jgi:hypothetical protein
LSFLKIQIRLQIYAWQNFTLLYKINNFFKNLKNSKIPRKKLEVLIRKLIKHPTAKPGPIPREKLDVLIKKIINHLCTRIQESGLFAAWVSVAHANHVLINAPFLPT